MRLIDADELNFEKLQDTNGKAVPANEYIAFLKGAIAAEELIKNAPTVDVEPVVHAHWIDNGNGGVYCSQCKFLDNLEDEFGNAVYDLIGYSKENKRCRNCGAKMDEEQ